MGVLFLFDLILSKRRMIGKADPISKMKLVKSVSVFLTVLMIMLLCACGGEKTEDMFSLTVNGTTIKGNTEVSQYLDKLGDGYTYSESISCAYDGLDKIYSYEEFSIYTYPQGEQDYVLEVEVLGGSHQTAKGIKIGSSRDEILAAYGEDCIEEGILLYYNETNDAQDATAPMLYFVMEEGKVISFGVVGRSAE